MGASFTYKAPVLIIFILNNIPYRGIYVIEQRREHAMKGHTTTHEENKQRLNRIEGQVRAVSRMIDDSEYCIDIITQIQAARSALQSVGKIILEKHLKHCVAGALEAHDEAVIDEKLQEIMTVIKRMGK
jgi:DNA-binding FrmR family transcriptional regulator